MARSTPRPDPVVVHVSIACNRPWVLRLPAELRLDTLSFLDTTSVLRFGTTCREAQSIVQGDDVWRTLCARDLQPQPPTRHLLPCKLHAVPSTSHVAGVAPSVGLSPCREAVQRRYTRIVRRRFIRHASADLNRRHAASLQCRRRGVTLRVALAWLFAGAPLTLGIAVTSLLCLGLVLDLGGLELWHLLIPGLSLVLMMAMHVLIHTGYSLANRHAEEALVSRGRVTCCLGVSQPYRGQSSDMMSAVAGLFAMPPYTPGWVWQTVSFIPVPACVLVFLKLQYDDWAWFAWSLAVIPSVVGVVLSWYGMYAMHSPRTTFTNGLWTVVRTRFMNPAGDGFLDNARDCSLIMLPGVAGSGVGLCAVLDLGAPRWVACVPVAVSCVAVVVWSAAVAKRRRCRWCTSFRFVMVMICLLLLSSMVLMMLSSGSAKQDAVAAAPIVATVVLVCMVRLWVMRRAYSVIQGRMLRSIQRTPFLFGPVASRWYRLRCGEEEEGGKDRWDWGTECFGF